MFVGPESFWFCSCELASMFKDTDFPSDAFAQDSECLQHWVLESDQAHAEPIDSASWGQFDNIALLASPVIVSNLGWDDSVSHVRSTCKLSVSVQTFPTKEDSQLRNRRLLILIMESWVAITKRIVFLKWGSRIVLNRLNFPPHAFTDPWTH